MGGKVGVNCFVLISGYFLVNKTKFDIRKLFLLWMKCEGYCLLFLLLEVTVFGGNLLNVNRLVRSLMPVISSHYWFMTAYTGLFLLYPFLNRLIASVNQKEFRGMMIIILFISTVIPTFTSMHPWFSDLTWFMVVYLCGAYIRKYIPEQTTFAKWKWLILVITITFGSGIVFSLIEEKLSFAHKLVDYFCNIDMLTTFATSILIFLLMRRVNLQSRYINRISSHVLGVYFIQSNVFISNILWEKLSFVNDMSPAMYFVSVFSLCMLIFIICIILDILQDMLYVIFRKNIPKFIWKWYDHMCFLINSLYSKKC